MSILTKERKVWRWVKAWAVLIGLYVIIDLLLQAGILGA